MIPLILTADCVHHIVGVERERDLLAMWAFCKRLERFTADEIVIELDVRTVAQIPRRQVVVFDVRRIEAAADRRLRLVAIGWEPLSIRLHLVAGIDRWQR